MKKKRFIAVFLMLILCMALCACGGSDGDNDSGEKKHKTSKKAEVEKVEEPEEDAEEEEESEEEEDEEDAEEEDVEDAELEDTEPEAPRMDAETRVCGEFSVEVPAGWEFEQGDFFDENDTRYFSVKKSMFSYFDFSADGEENIKQQYDYNKNTYTNEQEDKKGTFGDVEWVGFQYSDGYGGYGIEAYATIDGVMIRVSSAGFKFDAAETKIVLSSVKHVEGD